MSRRGLNKAREVLRRIELGDHTMRRIAEHLDCSPFYVGSVLDEHPEYLIKMAQNKKKVKAQREADKQAGIVRQRRYMNTITQSVVQEFAKEMGIHNRTAKKWLEEKSRGNN